jgi:phage terminase large subunit-like protein
MTVLEDLLSPEAKRELQLRRLRQIAHENRKNELADPVGWIEKNFYIPELTGPLELQPYQKAVLRESQRKDENGKFIYSIVVWSDIKKSAKSTIAAAMALYIAHLRQWGSVKVIANDLKQADSRVAYYLRRAIELNPRMVDTVKQVRYKTTIQGNSSTIEAIPIDPGGEAGGNDDLLIFSEMWAAKHKAIQTMWTEMTLSPTKFGYSQRWIETYAGHQGESPILEQLYRQGIKEGRKLDLSYTDKSGQHHDLSDLEVYANGPLLCLWNTKPRCPWQTSDYYASEAAVLTPNEFNRIRS